MAEARKGNRDLDLLFEGSVRQELLATAGAMGWVCAHNPRNRDDPSIVHLFALGDDCRLFHLHCYLGIVTGESWLKEFRFPLAEKMLANAEVDEGGLRRLSRPDARYLVLVRTLLKSASISSRMLLKAEADEHRAEWEELGRGGGAPSAELAEIRQLVADVGVDGSLEVPVSFLTAIHARWRLRQYRRFPYHRLPVLRATALARRLLYLSSRGSGRLLKPHGAIIAVVGSDGSGKSTLLDGLESLLSAKFRVERIHIGRPIYRLPGFLASGESTMVGKNPGDDPSTVSGLTGEVRSVALAGLRYSLARRGDRQRRKGIVVLSDRWPSIVVGSVDGPRVSPTRLLSRIESWFYQNMTKPDLVVRLRVDVEEAVHRNRDRIKESKETDDQIRFRHSKTELANYRAVVDVEIDANRPPDQVFANARELAWQALSGSVGSKSSSEQIDG